MSVAVVQIEIVIPEAASLKDRRRVVRSLKDRLRREFNVSVAEMDETADLWQRASIGLCTISADAACARGRLERACDAAVRWLAGQEVVVRGVEILDQVCRTDPSAWPR